MATITSSMREITVDEAWTLCMKDWSNIARAIRRGSEENVEFLKRIHTSKLDGNLPVADCFFCERSIQIGGNCQCPPTLIDKKFRCSNEDYHYRTFPLLFYKEIQRLYRIYKRRRDKE